MRRDGEEKSIVGSRWSLFNQRTMNTIGKEYLATVIRRVKYYKDLCEKAFEQLDEKDFHFRPNEESNSIAIIHTDIITIVNTIK